MPRDSTYHGLLIITFLIPLAANRISKIGVLNQSIKRTDTNELSKFRNEILKEHNSKREIHRSPSLQLDDDLNKKAEQIAVKAGQKGKFENDLAAANVFMGCSTYLTVPSGKEVADAWYNEVCGKGFNFQKVEGNEKSRSFSQVVWKDSRKIGIGYLTKKMKNDQYCTFAVAVYRPPGNIQGFFKENVDRGNFSQDYCCTLGSLSPECRKNKNAAGRALHAINKSSLVKPVVANKKSFLPAKKKSFMPDGMGMEPRNGKSYFRLPISLFAAPDPGAPLVVGNYPAPDNDQLGRIAVANGDRVMAQVVPSVVAKSEPEIMPRPQDLAETQQQLIENSQPQPIDNSQPLFENGQPPEVVNAPPPTVETVPSQMVDPAQQGIVDENQPMVGDGAAIGVVDNTQPQDMENAQPGPIDTSQPLLVGNTPSQFIDTNHQPRIMANNQQQLLENAQSQMAGSEQSQETSNAQNQGFNAVLPQVEREMSMVQALSNANTRLQAPSLHENMVGHGQPLLKMPTTSQAFQNKDADYSTGEEETEFVGLPMSDPYGQFQKTDDSLLLPYTPIAVHRKKPKAPTAEQRKVSVKHEIKVQALSEQNNLRRLHGAPDLTLNDEMCQEADDYAYKIASSGKFEHSGTKDGENLFYECKKGDDLPPPGEAIKSWYEEVCPGRGIRRKTGGYNFVKELGTQGAGHFTQMIWKNSTDFCLGLATKRVRPDYFCTYYVGRYRRRGNVISRFKENVPKGQFSDAICTESGADGVSLLTDILTGRTKLPRQTSDVISKGKNVQIATPVPTSNQSVPTNMLNSMSRNVSNDKSSVQNLNQALASKLFSTATMIDKERAHTSGGMNKTMELSNSTDNVNELHSPRNTSNSSASLKYVDYGANKPIPIVLNSTYTPLSTTNKTNSSVSAPQENQVHVQMKALPIPTQNRAQSNIGSLYTLQAPEEEPLKPADNAKSSSPTPSTNPSQRSTMTPAKSNEKIDQKENFRQQMLKLHNYFRHLHGSPSLTLDDKLNKRAQSRAVAIAKTEGAKKSIDDSDSDGENVYTICHKPDDRLSISKAYLSWYRQVCRNKFQFSKDGPQRGTRKFAQVIWKPTKKFGIDYSTIKRSATTYCTYVVARYSPGSNEQSQKENVPKGKFDGEKMCGKLSEIAASALNDEDENSGNVVSGKTDQGEEEIETRYPSPGEQTPTENVMTGEDQVGNPDGQLDNKKKPKVPVRPYPISWQNQQEQQQQQQKQQQQKQQDQKQQEQKKQGQKQDDKTLSSLENLSTTGQHESNKILAIPGEPAKLQTANNVAQYEHSQREQKIQAKNASETLGKSLRDKQESSYEQSYTHRSDNEITKEKADRTTPDNASQKESKMQNEAKDAQASGTDRHSAIL